jgi:hypothetical protein
MSLPAILFTSSRFTAFNVSLALADEFSMWDGCSQLSEIIKAKSATMMY